MLLTIIFTQSPCRRTQESPHSNGQDTNYIIQHHNSPGIKNETSKDETGAASLDVAPVSSCITGLQTLLTNINLFP